MALYQSGSGLGALVGVGTTNPTSNLQVYGTPIAAGNVFSVLNTAASGNVAQFSSSAGTALIINSIGNVGIGTANPTSNLQVVGNVLSGNVISSVAMYGVLAGSNTVAASTVTATSLIGTHYGAIVGSNTIAASTIYGVIGGANTIACSSVTAQGTAAAGAIYMTGSQLEIGQGQTSDTASYIDLHSAEGTYSAFSFRILRNGGANAPVYWINRGSGNSYFQNQDSGDFYFQSGGVSIGAITASGAIYFGKSNYTATTGTRPGTNIVYSYDCATPATPTASATYYGQNVLFSSGNMSGRMWNNSGAPSFYAGDTFLQATGCYDGTNNGTGASSQFAGNLYLDGGLSWCLGGSGTTTQCYAGGIYFRTGLSGGGLTTGTATNRMVIMPNTGYVGIGTVSPGYLFDVAGVVRAGSTVASSIYLTNSEVKWRGDGTAHFSIFNQNSTFQIRNTSGNSEPGTAGSNLITINTTGNVGIGTTNPYAILHIDSGSATSNIATAQPMASGALIAAASTGYIGAAGEYSPLLQFRQRWYTSTDTVATGGISGRKDNGSGEYGGGLQLWYCPNGSQTLSPGMALDQNGRVGIGTVNPQNTLHVSGGRTRLVAGGETYALGVSYSEASGGMYWIGATNSGTPDLVFSQGGGSERMRITNGGNVGIGTASLGGGQGKLFVANDVTLGGGNYAGDVAAQIMAVGSTNPLKRLALMYDTTNNIGLVQAMIAGTGTSPLCLNAAGGNVGIGITNPSQTLDVNGAVRVRGNLYNADGTTGYVQLNTGITTIPGYLAFYKSDNTRVGYIGWQYDSVNLVLETENGYTGYVFNSKLGVGVAPASYNFQVSGTIGASGDITALYSDERLKTKTGTLTGALDKVCSLETFTYRNNELAQSFGFKDDYQRVGVSAQQVQKVLPEAVRPAPFDAENQSGQNYLTVQYEKLVPLLIEALKEERAARLALEEKLGLK